MMKRFLSLLMIPISMISGCQKSNDSSSSIYQEPIYNEVEHLHIHWEDLFNQNNDKYYAYIYSVICTPCSMLREQVIDFALKEEVPFYFVNPNDDIPFTEDASLADASINATSIDQVYCYSTPTLIEITNRVITRYSRDYYEIKSFIESFNKGE